jgi:predicted XRE-type DNA-binding protein
MSGEHELVRGSDNPFWDVDAADAGAELTKADLAVGIVRVLQEPTTNGAAAAHLASVSEADISGIRKSAPHRFTIDRLARIPSRLDRGTRVRVDFSDTREGVQPSAPQP